MRIAVMGAGSTGGYFGGMLSRGGNDVFFIARGAHLEAIRRHGLRVVRDDEEFTVDCPATDEPSCVGPVELCLLTVKTYQNDVAIPAMAPLVGPGDDRPLPAERCGQLPGVRRRLRSGASPARSGLHRGGPSFSRYGHPIWRVVRVVFGEIDGRPSARGPDIQRTLAAAGIPAEFTADIHTEPVEQVPVHRHHGRGYLVGPSDPGRADAAPGVAKRGAGLPSRDRAGGPRLGSWPAAKHLRRYSCLHRRQPGRPSRVDALGCYRWTAAELEALNGAAVRAGQATGTPTPINDVIYAMLKPWPKGLPSPKLALTTIPGRLTMNRHSG